MGDSILLLKRGVAMAQDSICEYIENGKKCRKVATSRVSEYGCKEHNFCQKHSFMWLVVDNELNFMSLQEEVKELGFDFDEFVKLRELRKIEKPTPIIKVDNIDTLPVPKSEPDTLVNIDELKIKQTTLGETLHVCKKDDGDA